VMKSRRLAYLKRAALQAHALKYDLDPSQDYGRPGNSPAERAFHLLSCGFDMLLVVLGPDGFPSLHSRTRKRGSKWVRQRLPWQGAAGAGVMARAVPALLAAMGGRIGDDAEGGAEPVVDPQFHLALKRSVDDFFSAPGKAVLQLPFTGFPDKAVLRELDQCTAEFAVLESGKPREEVARGERPANRYSLALLNGEDPHTDPELVEMQRRYARDYFIYTASLAAMKAAMAAPDMQRLSRKVIPFLDPEDPRISKYRARALAAWIEGSRPYREYALMEFQNASVAAPG
jgi:hypothetical protein